MTNGYVDVAVVGAGQAGLVMGRYLDRLKCRFILFDSAPAVGHSWRCRWDSLRLLTSARHSSLPGLRFPAQSGSHPGKDQVADYLERYAAVFALPVQTGVRVQHVSRGASGFFSIDTSEGRWTSRAVVIATGPFQEPFVPGLARSIDDSTVQLHSADYRNAGTLPDGPVLVVGSGNSGVEIANDIAGSRPVYLAAGSRRPRFPQRVAGRDVFDWLGAARAMTIRRSSSVGRRLRLMHRELTVGTRPTSLRRHASVEVRLRVVDTDGSQVVMADQTRVSPTSIIWATGYRANYDWLDLPVLGLDGRPMQVDGVTPEPGVFTIGLHWQRTAGSAFLGWVGRDAAALVPHIERYLEGSTVPEFRPGHPVTGTGLLDQR